MTSLPLYVHPTATELGQVAGERAVAAVRAALESRGRARVMLAAAPSQSPVLGHLATSGLDFSDVTFFHMDDYLGLDPDAPQAFGTWLTSEFFERMSGGRGTFHRIDTLLDPQDSARQYADLMGEEPFDLTLCGLGVNAHLAFNDPPANFEDPQAVRVVELDRTSREQQVGEGHFPDVDSVPQKALTVTIPRLLNARTVICSVLGAAKRRAVADTLALDPTPEVPGTALKTHPNVELHVDEEAMGR